MLLAISAAGYDLAELQQTIRRDGVDLRAVSPALIPASDVYARHTVAIEARFDREITSGGYRDVPFYVKSWTRNQPTSPSLHDTERALVEHVVESVVLAADAKAVICTTPQACGTALPPAPSYASGPRQSKTARSTWATRRQPDPSSSSTSWVSRCPTPAWTTRTQER